MRGKDATQASIPLPDDLHPTLQSYLTYDRPRPPTSDRLSANPTGFPAPACTANLRTGPASTSSPATRQPQAWAATTTIGRATRMPPTASRRGASLAEVRRLLGHTVITTGVRYLHLTDRDTRTCIDRAFNTHTTTTTDTTPASQAAHGTGVGSRDSTSLPASPARVREPAAHTQVGPQP